MESQLSCLDIHLFCRVPMLLCAPLRFSLHLSLSLSLSASWPVYIYEALSLYHPSSFLLDVVSTVNCVGSPGHFSFSWEHSLTWLTKLQSYRQAPYRVYYVYTSRASICVHQNQRSQLITPCVLAMLTLYHITKYLFLTCIEALSDLSWTYQIYLFNHL